MECCFFRNCIFLIISLVLLECKETKVAVCFKESATVDDVKLVAREFNYNILKQVGELCYIFVKNTDREKRDYSHTLEAGVETLLLSHSLVKEAEVSIPKIRVKRGRVSSKRANYARLDALARTFDDPMFDSQWHLHNTEFSGKDLNVLPVWAHNTTGRGIIVAILDDGVEYTHPDIRDNYDASVSWDFIDDDSDPMPATSPSDSYVEHGTRCAGQVAASKNNICGVGVAFDSKIAAIRMLTNKVEDGMEADALKYCRDQIHIYSSSWGPMDDGKKMDGPGVLVRNAFEEGVKYGRNGRGSIYVWASGNGGKNRDNCNCDGYCSSIYTITISAVNDKGLVPAYVEECSATLAAAYSSGTDSDRKIVTTDLHGECTEDHGGTSAAAPLAAGAIALALSANPDLSWRDVQHLIVHSSSHPSDRDSIVNGAKRRVNSKIGFGVLDVAAMVNLAKTWQPVTKQHKCTRIIVPSRFVAPRDARIQNGKKMKVTINVTACEGLSTEVNVLEHVQAVLSVEHEFRGSLKIHLVSPSGTISPLLTERPSDNSDQGFVKWSFLSVQMWGERAAGTWVLTIESSGSGELTYFELILYGTKHTPTPASPSCSLFSLPTNDGSVTCVATCPPTGYYVASARRCLPCHPTCFTCSDYNVCSSCPDNMYLLEGENTCVSSCSQEYHVVSSPVYGDMCRSSKSLDPWYKGETIYIIIVVVFVTILIIVVLLIGMHQYRKCKNRSSSHTRMRESSLYPHTQLKPVHLPNSSHAPRDTVTQHSRVPSRGNLATSSRTACGSYGNNHNSMRCCK